MFGHAAQLRAACTDDEARLLVASALDAFYYEDPDHEEYEYFKPAREEARGALGESACTKAPSSRPR